MERVDNLEPEGVTGGDYPDYVDIDYKRIGREVDRTKKNRNELSTNRTLSLRPST